MSNLCWPSCVGAHDAREQDVSDLVVHGIGHRPSAPAQARSRDRALPRPQRPGAWFDWTPPIATRVSHPCASASAARCTEFAPCSRRMPAPSCVLAAAPDLDLAAEMLAQTLESVHRRGPEEERHTLVRVQSHATASAASAPPDFAEQLADERAVPLHRDDAVGLLLDVRAPATPHLVEPEGTVGGLANRAREQVGLRRGNHDSAADFPDETRGLAFGHRRRRSPDGPRRESRTGGRVRYPASPFCEADDGTSALERGTAGSHSRFGTGESEPSPRPRAGTRGRASRRGGLEPGDHDSGGLDGLGGTSRLGRGCPGPVRARRCPSA